MLSAIRALPNKLLRKTLGVEIRRVGNAPATTAPANIERSWEHPAPRRHKHYLAACAIFRNEAPYLKEWIEYHRLVGVEKFFLYNNQSDDNFFEVLKPYLDSGVVELKHWQFAPPCQTPAYDDCIAYSGESARWIAFIDVDEFLLPTEERSLSEVLSEYEDAPGVVVYWLQFGTSNHVLKPTGLTLENYVACKQTPSSIIKSIVDPHRIARFDQNNPHAALYLNGEHAVTEDRRPMLDSRKPPLPPSTEKLRINHYWSRSVEEFLAKHRRGSATSAGHHLKLDRFITTEQSASASKDFLIQRYLPDLRKRMAEAESASATVGPEL